MINESVQFVMNSLLNEMFIEGKRNLKDGAFILAYRSKIWVVQDAYDLKNLSKKIQSSIKKETKVKSINSIRDKRPDVLQGQYRDNGRQKILEIYSGLNFQHNIHSSLLIKKVSQALGVEKVVYSDSDHGGEVQSEYTQNLQAKVPNWAYHGTSSKYLMSILKNGLQPKPDQTNFSSVVHEDHIFLTLDPVKACFHAQIAAGDEYSPEYNPIIFKVKIPDPNLIQADYDVDKQSGQTTYKKMYKKERDEKEKGIMPGDPTKLSKSFGIFAYKGKILPQHIEEVHVGPKATQGESLDFNDFDGYDPSYIKKNYQELEDVTGGVKEYGIDLKDFFQDAWSILSKIEQEQEDAE